MKLGGRGGPEAGAGLVSSVGLRDVRGAGYDGGQAAGTLFVSKIRREVLGCLAVFTVCGREKCFNLVP